MAFGDLVKYDDSAFSATQSCDLGSNPTSGNILFFFASNGNYAATVSTPPTGFTQLQINTGGAAAGAHVAYYKVSVGTEQTASLVWSGGLGKATYIEIDFDGNTLDSVQSNKDQTYTTGSGTSISTGSLTPDQSTNVIVAGVGAGNESGFDGGQAWDGTEIVYRAMTTATQTGQAVAGYTNETGSISHTFSTTDGGGGAWGIIAAFNVAASGPSIPVLAYHYNQMR